MLGSGSEGLCIILLLFEELGPILFPLFQNPINNLFLVAEPGF